MANRKVYVDGTTSGTPGTDGAHYASLAAAISGEVGAAANLVTGTCVLSIEISKTDADTDAVTVEGFTTSSDYYINIYTTAAARHAGVWSDSKYRLSVSNATVLSLQDDYIRVEGLQIEKTSSSGADQSLIYVGGQAAANEIRVSKILGRQKGNASYTEPGIYASDADLVLKVWNCIFYGGSTNAGASNIALLAAAATSVEVYNSTLIGGLRGLRNAAASSVVAKNCYAWGTQVGTYDVYSGTITMTNCAAADATASGTNPYDNIAKDTSTGSGHAGFENVTAGSEDFRIKSGSDLQDHGATISESAPFNYTDDIAGNTRGASWDIGASEYVVAAQFARPASTVAAGNWDGFIAGVDQNDSSNLDNYIDETTADDNDSIRSGTSPSDDSCTIGLSEIQTPAAGTVTMRIRARFL